MKTKKNLPLVITTCITPSPILLGLNDPKLRLYHTLEGIQNWLSLDLNLKIVICDGSNFDLSSIVKARFPKHNIECLSFQSSINKVSEQGKGYGEGEILAFALAHSDLLTESDAFMKCTGKLWVTNYKDCLNEWNGIFSASAQFANIFNFKKPKLEQIDTRFYITDKEFFLTHLLDAHFESNFNAGSSIENLFLKSLNALKMQNYIFSMEPIICGMGGGSGKYYKNNLRRQLKGRLRRLIAKNSSDLKKIFLVKPSTSNNISTANHNQAIQ